MWAVVLKREVCYFDHMKSGGKAILWLVTGFTLTMANMAQANNSGSSSDGPYRAIVDRNVFDLRPVPPPTVNQNPATPPPNVKLVGVMMITDHVQGVFSVQDPTPGKQPVSYILSQDQRQGTLEVKSISMADKSARVKIGDEIVLLKLDDPKAPTGPAPGSVPAAGAASPRQRTFMPGARATGQGAFPMPMPVPGQPAGGAPSASYSPGVSPDAGNGALPTRPVRTDANEQQQAMTPEQQIINLEQTREQYSQNNDPRLQILPPSPLTPGMQAQQNTGVQDTGGTTTPAPTGNQLPVWMRPKSSGSAAPPCPDRIDCQLFGLEIPPSGLIILLPSSKHCISA